nr:uncharacterized protein LOC125990997 [Syngnathus scovelli]
MTQAEVQKNELMCPLVTTSGGQHYEPMVLRDVTAMMENMPPLHRGGKVWLNKFLALMSGQSCTLGDMRQMLAGACSLVQLQAIEEAAGTARLGREVPLPQVAAPLFENIKLTFPQPTDLAPTMFPYDVKMSPAQHYVTCVDSWIETTGRHPALTHEAEVLFRTALLDGLPPDVKKQLMSDPDILVCAEERFKRHLLHHCRMFTESQAKVENETDALSNQLLKLQLAKCMVKLNSLNHRKRKCKCHRLFRWWGAEGASSGADTEAGEGVHLLTRGGQHTSPIRQTHVSSAAKPTTGQKNAHSIDRAEPPAHKRTEVSTTNMMISGVDNLNRAARGARKAVARRSQCFM